MQGIVIHTTLCLHGYLTTCFSSSVFFFFFFLCAFLEIAGAKGEGAPLFIAEVYSAGIL